MTEAKLEDITVPTIQAEELSSSEDEEKDEQEAFNQFEFQSDDDGL